MTKLPDINLSKYQAFDEAGATISGLSRFNVFVGPNNVGKSKLLQAAQRLSFVHEEGHYLINASGDSYAVEYDVVPSEAVLKTAFPSRKSAGALGSSNWWEAAGKYLLSKRIRVRLTQTKSTGIASIDYDPQPEFNKQQKREIVKALSDPNLQLGPSPDLPFGFFVAAERDVKPEGAGSNYDIQPGGSGVTNVVRHTLLTTSQDPSLVRTFLLDDLNKILHPQYTFSDILVRLNEQSNAWEICLATQADEIVRLSQSGSGLKTLFCLLANVHLKMRTKAQPIQKGMFILEELENSLHPRVQRNLYQYLREKFVGDSVVLISSHSPIAIDFFRSNSDVSFYQVTQELGKTRCRRVEAFDDHLGILDALGVKASDALMSNFVVWVEGPTDRIYVNHGLRLVAGDKLREGRDYSVMFYGGKLLSHLTADASAASDELIKLLNINPNCAIVIDSDREKKEAPLNATKNRIVQEFDAGHRMHWVTAGREIENYLTPEFLKRTLGYDEKTDDFDRVFEKVKGLPGPSGESVSGKIDLAAIAEKHASLEDFRLDWRDRIDTLASKISKANS